MKSQLTKTNKNKAYLLALSLVLTACGDSANGDKSARGKGKKPEKATPVELTVPQIGTAASYFVTTATLEPSSDAKINARTSGVARQILREEGDDVQEGELLLLLEDDDQRLRLKQAEQNLASAEREFRRLSKMKKAGVVSPTEWEAANNAFLSAEVELELAQLALSYTRIVAPITGRVVWREVDLGAHVTSGELLFRVMAINPLLVRVQVPANRIGQVAKGQPVELRVDSVEKPLDGTVGLVSPIVDPTTGTIKVTLTIDDYPPQVRPGDFTEIRMITDKREQALLLPSVAIIEERGQHYLFVEQASKAVRKKIEIGYVLGEQTEVISGIEAGEKVVSKGQRNLNDGNLLQIIDAQEPSPQQAKQSKTPATAGSDT